MGELEITRERLLPCPQCIDESGTASSERRTSTWLANLVTPHLDRMLSAAMRILKDREFAQDAVQDAVWALWNSKELPENLGAWLVTTAVNRAKSRGRAERRRCFHETERARSAEAAIEVGASGNVEAVESARRLHEAVRELPVKLRRIIELRLDDADYSDIARRMGIPIGTVRSRLSRARAALAALAER